MENLGFNLEKELAEQSKKDWVFGGIGDITEGIGDECAGLIVAGHAWPTPVNGVYPKSDNRINHAFKMISEFCKKYLPLGQIQQSLKAWLKDWMNCATNAPINEDETQSNYIVDTSKFSNTTIDFLKKYRYINPDNGKFEVSNAFNSILSGTTKKGNSFKAPLESMRLKGIIPLWMLPDDRNMNWDEYHNPDRITQDMKDLGKEFLTYISINYEKVYFKDFKEYSKGLVWEIFDSYIDNTDGDFIKKLAPDYKFLDYGYHLIINDLRKDEDMRFIKTDDSPHIYQVIGDTKVKVADWSTLEAKKATKDFEIVTKEEFDKYKSNGSFLWLDREL